jgi:hypothetical protein
MIIWLSSLFLANAVYLLSLVFACCCRRCCYSNAMDKVGRSMEVTQYKEKLVPSTRFVAVDGKGPKVTDSTFVAPSASVIGNVSIGKASR